MVTHFWKGIGHLVFLPCPGRTKTERFRECFRISSRNSLKLVIYCGDKFLLVFLISTRRTLQDEPCKPQAINRSAIYQHQGVCSFQREQHLPNYWQQFVWVSPEIIDRKDQSAVLQCRAFVIKQPHHRCIHMLTQSFDRRKFLFVPRRKSLHFPDYRDRISTPFVIRIWQILSAEMVRADIFPT